MNRNLQGRYSVCEDNYKGRKCIVRMGNIRKILLQKVDFDSSLEILQGPEMEVREGEHSTHEGQPGKGPKLRDGVSCLRNSKARVF